MLFVYNADGTVFGLLSDAAHKALSPRTYQCDLCRLTYGLVRQKPQWRSFVSSLPVPAAFLHRDEFRHRYPGCASAPLPAIFVQSDGGSLELLISAAELSAVQKLDELEALVADRVAAIAA